MAELNIFGKRVKYNEQQPSALLKYAMVEKGRITRVDHIHPVSTFSPPPPDIPPEMRTILPIYNHDFSYLEGVAQKQGREKFTKNIQYLKQNAREGQMIAEQLADRRPDIAESIPFILNMEKLATAILKALEGK